jgi:hypothetical protein
MLVTEQLEPIHHVECYALPRTYSFGSLQRPATHEDTQAPEQHLLVLVEQVVAPVDRRAQRALAIGQGARSAGQQRKAVLQACQQRPWGQDPDAGGR